MNRYTQLYNLIQQVEFGDNREHIGQALMDFAALALKEGLPFATQYGALEAGRALNHVAKTDAKQVEFGFNAETYGRARGLLDVAREALRHAMGQYDIRAELILARGTDEVKQAWHDDDINMNGTRVHKVQGGTMFIPLPKAIQRLCGGCSCPWCTTDRKQPNPDSRWDTLAVHPNRTHTWEVHMPEIHGKPKLRND